MSERRATRRLALAAGGSALAALAGCISTSPTPPGSGGDTDGGGDGGGGSVPLLRAGGSSTVFPIANRASSYWGSNAAPDDEEYWGPEQYDIDTDAHLADYWAGLYGFGPADGGVPPFEVKVNLSHSGTGLENLKAGRVDIGNSSAPVSAELPEASEEELSKFENHVVGVDAQPIVISQEVYDAGVTHMTAETLRAIYKGDITDWRDVPDYDGPSKQIQCIGRAEGSGTDTAFRTNLYGDPNAPMPGIDVRKGQNQQVRDIVARSGNAIAYMALAFVDDSVPAISLTFEGTEYVPGENLSDPNYPLSRDLHCYTYEGTSEMEAAFLRMILSDYGQENFVKPVGYSALTQERQDEELAKLPDTV
ncbi:PstS family phosphate ABC transporter substrate-binding protein [Salarchaeum japonicum]|uniref:PstS family phosphate ABC transporter substrate-binding protein n=1 Tax=Salarchaeum japonicum TaxID=555573 RepID=UPI001D09E2C6|nr:substrate-binding domain-containing protein [Salarchaeum japonicum]